MRPARGLTWARAGARPDVGGVRLGVGARREVGSAPSYSVNVGEIHLGMRRAGTGPRQGRDRAGVAPN